MRRLIFALLYDRGRFMLSRNFRLQAVGTIDWLFNNYDFLNVSHGLDELIVLDVSKGIRDTGAFGAVVSHITSRCFVPVTVGGGITSFDIAQGFMRSGADKLLVNSAFANDVGLCRALAEHFGRQCIVGGIDYKATPQSTQAVMIDNGTREVSTDLSGWVEFLQENGAGEILFQSVDQDGTGMGLDLSVVDGLRHCPEVPCILMGGVGKADHIIAGLQHPTIDAVATANLYNFIGSAFLDVRKLIAETGMDMAQWNSGEYVALHNKFAASA
jgi:cyclase